MRESSHVLKRMDTRLRGYDGNKVRAFAYSSFPRMRESSHVLKKMDTRLRGYDGNKVRAFAYSSFPRMRESSHVLKRMDIRLRGYNGKDRQAKVLRGKEARGCIHFMLTERQV